MLWTYIPYHFIAIIFIIPVAALALALTFYKVNNRPFILIMESAFRYLINHKLYIWQKRDGPPSQTKAEATPARGLTIPKLSESRLKDLAWSLDVREKIK